MLKTLRYATKFPEVNFYTSSNWEFIEAIVGTKSSAWAHEREWRIVQVGAIGLVPIPSQMIDAVILGMKVKDTVEAEVRTWLKGRPGVELLRVVNKPRSFELALRRV